MEASKYEGKEEGVIVVSGFTISGSAEKEVYAYERVLMLGG
jgi:hypothetical protein